MMGERKSPRMNDQILTLHRRGIGKSKIAKMLGVSKNTVKGIIRLSGGQTLELVPPETGWGAQVAWDQVQKELGQKYVTIKCLHADYAPTGISYLRFWRELKKRMPSLIEDQARIRFQYKPGVTSTASGACHCISV